jgi:putative transposase
MRSAHLPGAKAARPAYWDRNAHVGQDMVHRLDQASHTFFRRVAAGEQPGYPRFQGRARSQRFT